jgi:deferrochelatase/peroxidase EfeB
LLGFLEENAMQLVDRLGGELPRSPATVELDDIQATVLRYRPEPYYGTHVMLHVEVAQAGREFVRRLTPYVDSAAGWWEAGDAWTSMAVSHTGLVALGVPEDSLRSFRKPSAWGWRRAPTSCGTTGRTIRRTGKHRSVPAASTLR